MQKKQLLLILVFAIATLTGVTFLYLFQTKEAPLTKRETQNSIPTPTLSQTQIEATLSFSPKTAGISVGQTLPLEIKLKLESLPLSAIALRWTYNFNQKLPLEPQGLKMKTNPKLTEQGGIYTINKVEVDQENQKVFGELAISIPILEGLPANEDLTLATLDFLGQNPIQNLIFEFDPIQTKAFTKNGKEIMLKLEETTYSIIPKL